MDVSSWGNVRITHHKFKKLFSEKLLIVTSLSDSDTVKIIKRHYKINFYLTQNITSNLVYF